MIKSSDRQESSEMSRRRDWQREFGKCWVGDREIEEMKCTSSVPSIAMREIVESDTGTGSVVSTNMSI